MNKMYYPVVALALGHLVTDMQAGALPIVLPQLKELFSLSYSQLAALYCCKILCHPLFSRPSAILPTGARCHAFCRFVRRWQVQALPLWAGSQLYAAFMHGYFYQPGERYLSPAGF